MHYFLITNMLEPRKNKRIYNALKLVKFKNNLIIFNSNALTAFFHRPELTKSLKQF